MRGYENDDDECTLYCGNISDQVTDEILYELFLQAGPLQSMRRPRDQNGRPKSFAFIVYKHKCSVPYALELFRGEKLFNRSLKLQSRSSMHHIPVLDTHLSEFTERLEEKHPHRNEGKDHRSNRRCLNKDRDDNEPTSWAELNALKGKSSLLNGHAIHNRDDLLRAPVHSKESNSQDIPRHNMAEFEKLLQMSRQMMPNMLPGMLPFGGIPFGGLPFPAGGSMGPVSPMGPMGLMAHNMYPSMQAGMSGGTHFPPEKERKRNDRYEGRGSRRDHPYQDKRQGSQYDNRRHSDNNYNHRRHDRGYSSSRSSHERERRDRRSR